MLYAFAAEILGQCFIHGKLFMVQNPDNSLFWFTTAWKECPAADKLFFQEHQACGYLEVAAQSGQGWLQLSLKCAQSIQNVLRIASMRLGEW
jgi:hypothetical protein